MTSESRQGSLITRRTALAASAGSVLAVTAGLLSSAAPADASAQWQSGWRFCSKCTQMVHKPQQDVGQSCPTGGAHNYGTTNYEFNHGSGSGQSDFRYCDNCYTMFWGPTTGERGVCAATNGQHVGSSYNYLIQYAGSNAGGSSSYYAQQTDWHYCDACAVVHWVSPSSYAVQCAGTGGRHHTGSRNYWMYGHFV